mgnify:FL=1
MKWDKYFSLGVGGIGLLVNYLWGGLDTMLTVLLTMMGLDFIAGLLCGAKDKKLDSEVAYLGITRKKMMILIMIAVAVNLDNLLGLDGSTRAIAIFYYTSMEGLSIIENAGKLGFPFPKKITDMLIQLQDRD